MTIRTRLGWLPHSPEVHGLGTSTCSAMLLAIKAKANPQDRIAEFLTE